MPVETETSVQKIIRDWEPEAQKNELQSRLQQFELIRFRLDPRVVPLLDEYRRVIENFLKNGHLSGVNAAPRKSPVSRSVRDEAVKELDLLDARRVSVALKSSAVAKSKKPVSSGP